MKDHEIRSPALAQPLQIIPFTGEKAALAGRLLCRTCEQKGVKVSSWHEFEAMGAYVDGRIDEVQLTEEARKELERHSELYGKYLLLNEENPGSGVSDEEKRRRARRASRIYRNICRNVGLSLCFFSSFSAWRDFVEGRIDELEFLRKVAMEAGRIGQDSQH